MKRNGALGGIETIISAMKDHPQHVDLQYNACGALEFLLVMRGIK
jgi:hypothetical protein